MKFLNKLYKFMSSIHLKNFCSVLSLVLCVNLVVVVKVVGTWIHERLCNNILQDTKISFLLFMT